MLSKSLPFFFCFLFALTAYSQQIPDTNYTYQLNQSAYPIGAGPVVYIDEGHQNFHTMGGGFSPFAKLLQQDGYQVKPLQQSPLVDIPEDCDLLVVSNALNESNVGYWVVPNTSAFTKDEIAIIEEWVADGGKLLLIADHMPFAGAANDLAKAFGFTYQNGFARFGEQLGNPAVFSRENDKLLASPPTEGANESEYIERVTTFTGSAFTIPENASPVLKFTEDDTSLNPDTAWRFNENTPMVVLEDHYQGAIMDYGDGKLAVFGEAAMFTAQLSQNGRKFGMNSDYAPGNAQFVLNLMHWFTGVTEYTGPEHEYPLSPEEQAILSKMEAMTQAYRDNDLKGVANIYSDNAVLIGENQRIEGRSAIDRYWMALEGRGISWDLENKRLEVDENMAFQEGVSRMRYKYDGEERLSEVRFTLVWQKIAGEWKIAVDHYSRL